MTQLNKNGKNLQLIVDAADKVYPEPDKHLLADLSIVQAILEGAVLNNPPSQLALKYNNLFGIKGIGTMGSVDLPTHEYYDKQMHTLEQKFAWNKNIEDSFLQHRKLLEHSRYNACWSTKTFGEIAHAVHDAGYATDPSYADELIRVYKEYFGDSV